MPSSTLFTVTTALVVGLTTTTTTVTEARLWRWSATGLMMMMSAASGSDASASIASFDATMHNETAARVLAPARPFRSARFLLGVREPKNLAGGTIFLQAVLTKDVQRDLRQHISDHSYLNPVEWYGEDEGDQYWNERTEALGLSGRKPSSPFTVACLLTHRRAWAEVVMRHVDYGIIFESDATFVTPHGSGSRNQYIHHIMHQMNSIDPTWELLNLGRCWDFCGSDQEIRRMSRHQSIVKSTAPGCTHAYLVTAEGAKKLLAWSLPYVLPVDFLMQLLTRQQIVNMYSVTKPFFIQNKTGDANDKDDLVECDPQEQRLLDSFSDVREADQRILETISSSWISTWVRDTFASTVDVPNPKQSECSRLDEFCTWVKGDVVEGPEETAFNAYFDSVGLDTFLIWGLSMSEQHTHRFIHEALYNAAERAFHTSQQARRLCWIPSNVELCAGEDIEHTLVFATPKHMTYTDDPGLKRLSPRASSRYIFHELVPPHFSHLQTEGNVVQWVVRGPDGSSPVHEAEHYVLKQSAPCYDVTCFIDEVYVAPWATRYRPTPTTPPTPETQENTVHFVGTIWWLNQGAFCDLVRGCNEVGVKVVRHGMSRLPENVCDGANVWFEDDWRSVSDEEAVKLQWDSLFVPVFQGAAHLDGDNSYISDRTFDTVAHGMKVITNNPLSAQIMNLPFAEAHDMCRVNQQNPVPYADPMAVATHTYLSRLNEMLDFFAQR